MLWKYLTTVPKVAVLTVIRAYQKTFSFDHGIFQKLFPYGYCKYHPSCSEYAYRSVERHGVMKGGVLSICRLLRCNPFSSGGNDPVPE